MTKQKSHQIIGLWVGDSFAEITGDVGDHVGEHIGGRVAGDTGETRGTSAGAKGPQSFNQRWFLPKKSLADGLKEALQKFDLKKKGEIRIALSRVESAISRRQTAPAAFLVTSGFETWLQTEKPAKRNMAHPEINPERSLGPVASERIFGIDERIHSTGEVQKPLTLSELEFLLAKLELLKVKDLGIGFLHSKVNPVHEDQASQFFLERGYRVTKSHLLKTDNERTAWRKAIEFASVEALLQEEFAQIAEALRQIDASDWEVKVWGETGLTPLDQANAFQAANGTNIALEKSQDPKAAPHLHLGLEEFRLVLSDRSLRLSIQPTGQIAASPWGFPSWRGEDRGFEPGPMLFGKSHQLTFLDVLYLLGRIQDSIEAFSERISEKSKARILETLFTFGKKLAAPGRTAVDANQIAQDLETLAIEEMAMTLSAHSDSKSFRLSGPLAFTLLPLLKKRRPDLEFQFAKGDLTYSLGHASRGPSHT